MRRRFRAARCLIVATLSVAAIGTHRGADDAGTGPGGGSSSRRPRIGLALSGGGARGAAHVGVLRVLEELRVPVDFVVGTSVGATVGGLYACGHSPEFLQLTFEQTDWADVFTDRPSRKNTSFRRKQDDAEALFRFELGLGDKGFILPAGLVAGQKLGFLLHRLALPATGTEHFDDLPIPFRAVATDLDTGEMVVLEDGDLAEALRASMAVPGVFTPVELDDRTLVDGGLVRNLPVDVLRALGAERIIAVEVTTRLSSNEDTDSVISIALQTISMLTDKNIEEQRALLGEDDILIEPDMDHIPATAFARFPEAVVIGEQAARAVSDRLRELSVPEKEFAEWLAGHRRGIGETRIDEVEVAPGSRVDARIIRNRVKTRPGQVLDLEQLQADLQSVYRVGEFEQVGFRLLRGEAGSRLVIEARDKSWGPRYMRLGLALEADFRGEGDFTVLGNYTHTQLDVLGAEWKNIVKIGRTNSLFSEFYQPLDFAGYWFIAPQIEALSGDGQSFNQRRNLGLGRGEGALGRVDIGAQFRTYGEFRFGFERGYFDSRDLTASKSQDIDADLGRLRARVILDRLDNAGFPRRGTLAVIEGLLSKTDLGADDAYKSVSLDLTQAVSFDRNTLVAHVRFATDLGSDLPAYTEFPLGGFLKLSGLRPGQLQGDVLGYGSLTYYRQIGSLPGPIGGGVFFGGALEAGNVWESPESAEFGDLRPAGLIFAGADTILGPLYLGYGRTDAGEESFYLVVGQPF